MFLLELIGEAGTVTALRLGPSPLHIGRAPTCDLVLNDASVSGTHAAVWASAGRAWIEDLRSRNGTTVNDAPARAVVELRHGDRVGIGGRAELRVRALAGGTARRWMLHDEASGASHAVRSDRFHIGAGPGADLILAGAPDAWLLVDADGALSRLTEDQDEDDLLEGAVLTLGPHRLRVVAAEDAVAATLDMASVWYDYAVEASLDGPGGPAATFRDAQRGAQHEVTAANRAVLVYVLLRQAQADRDKLPARAGWCDDEEVARAVWGKQGPERQLKVLVCRLRADLREAGFDPLVIEKRRGAIRLRVRA